MVILIENFIPKWIKINGKKAQIDRWPFFLILSYG